MGTSTGRTGGSRRALAAGAAVLALVLAAVLAVRTAGGEQDPARAMTVSYDAGTARLDFAGTTFAGEPLDTTTWRGTPTVVNFYASWCTVCDRELPDFERVSQDLAGSVRVVGVNPQSNDTDAAQAEMIARSGITFPTMPDPQDELLRQFNTTGGLPTTVFVDGEGVVRDVHSGLLTEAMLRERLAGLFGVTSVAAAPDGA